MTSCHPPAINQPLSSAHWQLSGIDVIDPKVARARQDDLVQRQFLGHFRDVPGDFFAEQFCDAQVSQLHHGAEDILLSEINMRDQVCKISGEGLGHAAYGYSSRNSSIILRVV